jgi:hypothetical protein
MREARRQRGSSLICFFGADKMFVYKYIAVSRLDLVLCIAFLVSR